VTDEAPERRQPPRGEAQREWERRRRLAEVFGDVLPESTSDDRDEPGEARTRGEGRGDAWLKEQVPPHHG
jgi:hypothetical protein